MSTAPPHCNKPELHKKRNDFARLENRRLPHGLRHVDGLGADELAVESGIAFLEEHFDHFLEVDTQLVEGLALTVRAGKTWHPPTDSAVSAPRSMTAVKCFMALASVPVGAYQK
jgi:hypothetical protein